jgi:hypothetical protein
MATIRHHIKEAICKIWLRPRIIHGRRCIKTNQNIYISTVIKNETPTLKAANITGILTPYRSPLPDVRAMTYIH